MAPRYRLSRRVAAFASRRRHVLFSDAMLLEQAFFAAEFLPPSSRFSAAAALQHAS